MTATKRAKVSDLARERAARQDERNKQFKFYLEGMSEEDQMLMLRMLEHLAANSPKYTRNVDPFPPKGGAA
jgi:hypothetical protein